MKPEQLQKFYDMAEPRSEEAIRKAEERKTKRKDKELLLKDLCARFPYGVKFKWCDGYHDGYYTFIGINEQYIVGRSTDGYQVGFIIGMDDIKPYLRPMSSMTEEEHNEWFNYYHEIELKETKSTGDYLKAAILGESASIDWLNKNMFDFRGLIPKDLALSTDEFNPYKE